MNPVFLSTSVTFRGVVFPSGAKNAVSNAALKFIKFLLNVTMDLFFAEDNNFTVLMPKAFPTPTPSAITEMTAIWIKHFTERKVNTFKGLNHLKDLRMPNNGLAISIAGMFAGLYVLETPDLRKKLVF